MSEPASADHAPDDSPPGGRLEYGALGDLVGLHLRMAQAATHRSFLDMLAPLDLTQKQVTVLWLVESNPGASQIQLATTLNMDRATTMAIVDRLDGRGLLERTRSKTDRRRQRLELTGAGKELLARAKTIIAEHERMLRARIGDDAIAAVLAALKRLYRGPGDDK